MKKQLLFAISIAVSGVAFSQIQNAPKVAPHLDQAKKFEKVYKGNESDPGIIRTPSPKVPYATSKAINETVIGQTTYDLQSNASVMRRIVRHGDGTISATWTYSSSNDLSAADRGTGYNYYNGTSWGSIPNLREEASTRTGWSSITSSSNGETVINHSGAGGLHSLKRTAKGTGAWTEATVPANSGIACCVLWPRTTMGGASGNTLHAVAITAPVANQGATWKGADGALLYYKSTDGGATWAVQDSVLPGTDTSAYVGYSGDEYAIASNGDNIAIAVFGQMKDVYLMKSTDNGATWTKTVIDQFPIPKYVADQPWGTDVNQDNIFDTITSSDGSGTLLVDANGVAHVWYGNMRYLDDNLTDGGYSYFPGTNGLMYWNETMGSNPPVMIAAAEDLDNDQQIGGVGIASYFTSLSGMPSSGMTSSGTIYVSYSSYMENKDQGSQNYRHVYLMASKDGGANWTPAIDVTTTDDFAECVFASMATRVDGQVHIVYQRDAEPGLAVRGDTDPFGTNDIVYLSVDTMEIVGINEQTNLVQGFSIYPNPAKENVKVNFQLKEAGMVNVSISNVMGQNVLDIKNEWTPAGNHSINISVNNLTKGIYFVNINNGNSVSSKKLVIN